MRAAGASFKVTKNRLARLALAGTKFERLSPMFTGPTAIAYSRDPVAAAKVAVEFANKNDKLRIIGGGLGERQLDAAGVKSLATLPSLDQLRAKLHRAPADPGDTHRRGAAGARHASGARARCLCEKGGPGSLTVEIILQSSQEC